MKIAITGHFRTGKDTAADIIAKHLTDQPVYRLGFAEELKHEVAAMAFNFVAGMFGLGVPEPTSQEAKTWDTEMFEDRSLNGLAWQWWGEWRRQKFGEDYWVQHPKFQLKYHAAASQGHVIITDMRHHNEAAWCISEGFFLLRIEGPPRVSQEEQRSPSHASEIHVADLPVHSSVYNGSSLEIFERNIRDYVMPKIMLHAGRALASQPVTITHLPE